MRSVEFRRRISAMRKLAFCLLLAGCGGGSDPVSCTLIACIQGLSVVISNPPSGAYRVDVIAPGETSPHSINCNGTNCGFAPIAPASPGATAAFFANYFSTTVTISIVPASGSPTTFNKTASYTTSFPNGPQCDVGGCTSAVVTVP